MKILGWSCFTALVFGVALAVLAPVSIIARAVTVPSQIEGLYGSIWRGRAELVGGYSVRWDTTGAGLLRGRIETPFSVVGGDTQVGGTLYLTPWRAELRDISGRAGPGLLALAEGMPEISCTARGILDVAHIHAMRGAFAALGTVTIEAGACTEPGGRVTEVPAMTLALTSEGDDAVARLRQDEILFATVILRGARRLALQVEPDGARLVPGLPTGGQIALEYPF